MKQYLLFDLDGTLTDPKVGITTCVQYALASFGIDEPDLDRLDPFIGPPLKDSFMNFYGMSEEQAQAAVDKYRERFRDKGIFENRLYGGVKEMLRELNAGGMVLAVASSKPTVFVERILEHFHIARYFKVVVGSELDGTRVNKDEVVEEALRRLFDGRPVEKDKVYMIGDRRFDTEGARAQGVESVGVAYGYGGMEELREARTDYIVRSVAELKRFLLRDIRDRAETPFQKSARILLPVALFWLVRNLGQYLAQIAFCVWGSAVSGVSFFFVRDGAGTLTGLTQNAGAVMGAAGCLLGTAAVRRSARRQLEDTAEDMRLLHRRREPAKNYLLLFLLTVGAVMGLNLLLELTGVTGLSQNYQAVAREQHAAAIWLGLPYYCLIVPFAEETVFRGIVYGGLRRTVKPGPAVLLSALLFGVYHFNLVQGIYGFLMGCLLAYAYEYFGTLRAALAVHAAANLLALCMGYFGKELPAAAGWPVCIGFLILAAGSLGLLYRQRKVF